MKVNDSALDTRFDFKVTPAREQPSTASTGDQNLPALIERPAAVLDINAPVVVTTPEPEDQFGNARDRDPESDGRRQIARNMIGLDVDVRQMTPREASEVGLQFYAEGLVSWDEYAELAFQPELHPAYNETIGALLGETASPDKPRDFVGEWTERLSYEQRYNAIDSIEVKSTQRIAAILSRLSGQSTNLDA